VVNVISFRTGEKRQKLTVFIDKRIPKNLISDDQRFSQVITNLLSNAVKFTPEEKSIRLEAHWAGEEGGTGKIKISVKDTGIGISAEQQARLFSSFQQADTSTSRKYGGTGLGLAISKHIVDMMGGKIWVESELGAGAIFSFIIPVERGAQPSGSPLLPSLDLSSVSLLLVHDNPETADSFAAITEQLGLTCNITSNSAEALEHLENSAAHNICFIEADIAGGTALELSRRLIAGGAKNIHIVMVSGYGWDDIAQEAQAAGVTSFLSKPLFLSAVADCINKCLAATLPATMAAPAGDTLLLKGRTMLLVDDIDINREIVLAMLEPTLMVIDCAANGLEAVRLFKKNPGRYDIVFMDIQMPELDGYEATQQIRALATEKAAKIPIIAMTANVFREDIEKCLEAGMSGHLGKPLDTATVLQVLQKYLT
jgi:CheY-like chemotaxis protein